MRKENMVEEKKPLAEGETEAAETAAEEKAETEEATPAREEEESSEAPAPARAKRPPSGQYADLLKTIEAMTVAELAEFVKALEDRFGVKATAPVMVGPGTAPVAGGETGAAGTSEQKTTFTVVLANSGDQKIAVIKALREFRPDLGLKEAKDIVDSPPKEVLTNAKKEEAEGVKAKLEATGATAELK